MDRSMDEIRKADILESFNASVETFLEEKPDIVVHLGDLLEGRASATIFNDLNTAINGLKTLLDSGIKVILLEGNHDFRRYADEENQPFTVIETALKPYTDRGDLVIVRAGQYRIIDWWARVPIVAVGYHDEGDGFRRFSNTLHRAAEELKGRRSILLTHQTVGDVWGIPQFYRIGDIPTNFVYVFNGHIHRRKLVVRNDPFHVFINPGSVEYQDMGEAWDVFELLKIYEDLESTYGRQKALEMFGRVVVKGVVFLDLDAPQLRNLMDPKDANIKGDDIPVYYWNSSRQPIFYHPLATSRPFLKATVNVKDFGKFREALETLISTLKVMDIKAPVLAVDALSDSDGFSEIQSYLLGALERGDLAALRITHRFEIKAITGEEGNKGVDQYAVFGEYAPIVRRVGSRIEEILDLKVRKEEARRGEKRRIEERVEALKREIKERIIGELYNITGGVRDAQESPSE